MKTEKPSNATNDAVIKRQEIVGEAVTNAAIQYIHGCEARIDDFVRRHYSLRGALRLHSHAIGLDIIRVPINIIWSLANILLAFIGFCAGLLRLRRIQYWSKKIPPGLETDIDRQISWLVITELLRLPHEQGGKRSDKDALMEEIMKDPSLQSLLNEELEAFKRVSGKSDFRERLNAKLQEYGATRTGPLTSQVM